jgi:hypothetical protein
VSAETWDIRHTYEVWLYNLVLTIRDLNDPRSYTVVCSLMHNVHFKDNVFNDDNRNAEGMELREEFVATLSSIEVGDYANLHDLGNASLLEMLIALARRADATVNIGVSGWFRIFLDNLGLMKYPDPVCNPRAQSRIKGILTVLNNRSYTPSGEGGLFPLKKPRKDQRTTELWYQMSAYISENDMY